MISPAARTRQLAAIHAMAKQIGLADEDYRAMLWSVARVHSARDLDHAGRQAVLDHLRARGGGKGPRRPAPPQDRAAQQRKVRALLADMNLPDAYADGIARNVCEVERWTWCTPEQLRKVIAALTYHQRRQQGRTPA